MILFARYLEEGVDLKIEIVDRRNSKVVGYSFIKWLLYIKKTLTEKDTTPLLDIAELIPIYKA
jgi:hypothetical protein